MLLETAETVAHGDGVCSPAHAEASTCFVLFLVSGFSLYLLIYLFVCNGAGHMSQHTLGDQRTTRGSHASPFTMWAEIQDLSSRQVPLPAEPTRQFPPHFFFKGLLCFYYMYIIDWIYINKYTFTY